MAKLQGSSSWQRRPRRKLRTSRQGRSQRRRSRSAAAGGAGAAGVEAGDAAAAGAVERLVPPKQPPTMVYSHSYHFHIHLAGAWSKPCYDTNSSPTPSTIPKPCMRSDTSTSRVFDATCAAASWKLTHGRQWCPQTI